MKILRQLIGYNLVLSPVKKRQTSRRMRLINIMRHANVHVPFYKGVYDKFLEHEKDLNDEEFFYAFSHLPVIEKQHLKQENDRFKSDHLEEKHDLLKDGQTPTVKEAIKHLVWKKDFKMSLSTGGSSGVPAFRWLDYDDANVFAQSFLHSFKLNGWKAGEAFTVFYPLKSYFTATYADHADTLNRFFGFTMVPFEDLNKEKVEELLDTLRKTKSTLLVIFPCVLQRIAQIMHDEGIKPFENLPYINVSGEFFMDCSKSFIQKMFPDSDIQCTYGAVEFGEIAHQKGLSSVNYGIFDDYAYLEQGPNNTILVTSYHQKAFPLIRYRIEDMGQIINNPDGSQSIQYLEGKNTDYLIGADGYMYFASFFNHMVNQINKELEDPIIHFMLRHNNQDDKKQISLNFVLSAKTQSKKIKQSIEKLVHQHVGNTFSNYDDLQITFPAYFEHDYTRKFKLIGEGDGMAEVVGGYYQRKAS